MPAIIETPPELKHVRSILAAVDSDDPTPEDIEAFRTALEDYPALWRVTGNLARNAATNLVYTTDAPESMKLSLRHGFAALQAELGADEASPLEQLLIEQVALSWLRLNLVEYFYTDIVNGDSTYTSRNYWERRLNAAQRRFLRACETLARIRKLGIVVQVNIANQQVNQAGREGA